MLFSIVTPTYNRAKYIEESVNSVLAQTYTNWELVIIDDASTDNTQEILQKYTDERIRVYKNEKNLERSESRNKGIELSKGTYVCFLDSDDYYLPNHLQLMYEIIALQGEPVALIHSNIIIEDKVKNENKELSYDYRGCRNFVEAVLKKHVQPNALVIHKTIFNSFRFDKRLNINEDVYLIAQIASQFPIIHLNKATVAWVIHGANTTNLSKDHLTPQLKATDLIFSDPNIKPNISKSFKNEKYFQLYTGLVYYHATRKNYRLSMYYTFKALIASPSRKMNRNNFLIVIYHLPLGSLLKSLVKKLHK
jgi:glycosyltransferase involved in cell wall biosynthesis